MIFTKVSTTILAVLLVVGTVGCASSPSIDQAQVADANNMLVVDNGPYDETKIVKGLDLSNYTGIIVRPVTINYSPERDDFIIPEDSLSEITGKFTDILVDEITTNSLRVVEKQGENTLLLEIEITDVAVNVPKDVKRNFNTKVYSKQPVSMAIEGQLFDSMSNEMLIKFNDKEMSESITFEEINRVTAGADMRQLMRRWSTKISQGLSSVAE
ncbi:hypothetical protein AVL56_19460 [Alteromonas stellipolaris]|nr:hypothetical protein AVL56_19460 [Alteromonas stellipolaris]